jgi:CheY-like chemotaxis protein
VTEPESGQPLRILSLDDDTGNQSLIAAIVSRSAEPEIRAAALLRATTIAEARSILASQVIDIVLLDVHLPDGLGLDLANDLRADGPSRPAVLALTASVLPVDQQAALDAGCDAFLPKPFAAPELLQVVQALARARNARIAEADSA